MGGRPSTSQIKVGEFVFPTEYRGIPVRPSEIIDFLSQAPPVDLRQLLLAHQEWRTELGNVQFQLVAGERVVDYYISPPVIREQKPEEAVSIFCVRENKLVVAVGECPVVPTPTEQSKALTVAHGVISVPAAVFQRVLADTFVVGGVAGVAMGVLSGMGLLAGPVLGPLSLLSVASLIGSGAYSIYLGKSVRRKEKASWLRAARAARELGLQIGLTRHTNLVPAANWLGRAQVWKDEFHVQGIVPGRERVVGVSYPDAVFVSGGISDQLRLLCRDFAARATRVFLYSPVAGEVEEYKGGEMIKHTGHRIGKITVYYLSAVHVDVSAPGQTTQEASLPPELSAYLQQLGQMPSSEEEQEATS